MSPAIISSPFISYSGIIGDKTRGPGCWVTSGTSLPIRWSRNRKDHESFFDFFFFFLSSRSSASLTSGLGVMNEQGNPRGQSSKPSNSHQSTPSTSLCTPGKLRTDGPTHPLPKWFSLERMGSIASLSPDQRVPGSPISTTLD